MTLDDEYESLYDSCSTYDELCGAIRALLVKYGHTDERVINTAIRGIFGGSTLRRDENGKIVDKWRCKFANVPLEDTQNKDDLAAA